MFGLQSSLYAEQISLPTISVEGLADEAIAYTIPPLSSATPDTGDLVKHLPAVNVSSNGQLSSIAQYRDLLSDHVNVLIDGVRLKQAGPKRMDSALSCLPSSRVAKVALFRGIATVNSGIETVGGTIIANSKQAKFGVDEEFEMHSSLTTRYAENGNTGHTGTPALPMDIVYARGENYKFNVAKDLNNGR
jgi:iron complex outermembrane receptor protein